MGFQLNVLVSSPAEPAVRARLEASLLARWPFLRRPREPGAEPADRVVLAPPELTEYLFDDDEAFETALGQSDAVEEGLLAFSKEWPGVTLAFVGAECFGGVCLFSGLACRAGEVLLRQRPEPRGHERLLEQVGLACEGYFGPFERRFFEGVTSGR